MYIHLRLIDSAYKSPGDRKYFNLLERMDDGGGKLQLEKCVTLKMDRKPKKNYLTLDFPCLDLPY